MSDSKNWARLFSICAEILLSNRLGSFLISDELARSVATFHCFIQVWPLFLFTE